MKKITITLLTILTIIITSTSAFAVDTFCEGFRDGYQMALNNNRVNKITPVCPVTPNGITSYDYGAGYGIGYSRALRDIENEN